MKESCLQFVVLLLRYFVSEAMALQVNDTSYECKARWSSFTTETMTIKPGQLVTPMIQM